MPQLISIDSWVGVCGLCTCIRIMDVRVCFPLFSIFAWNVETAHKQSYLYIYLLNCECEMRMRICCWFCRLKLYISFRCLAPTSRIRNWFNLTWNNQNHAVSLCLCLCAVRVKAKRWLQCLSRAHECLDLYLKQNVFVFETMQVNEMFSYILIVRFATLTMSMDFGLSFLWAPHTNRVCWRGVCVWVFFVIKCLPSYFLFMC